MPKTTDRKLDPSQGCMMLLSIPLALFMFGLILVRCAESF